MNNIHPFLSILMVISLSACQPSSSIDDNTTALLPSNELPNIVYILADDMGYGEIQALAPDTSKIPTPHLNQLAQQGMVFTDVHSSSSVCTPTRYGLLTGRYSWRTRLQRGVVQGFDHNLIAKGRPTVASLLKQAGYHTAILGKWHLDFNYMDPQSNQLLAKPKNRAQYSRTPLGTLIPDGPIERGFDYFYGIHHARSMQSIIENDRVIKHEDEIHFLPSLTKRSVDYINEKAKDTAAPFFLYLPLGSPHTPIVPSAAWQGKSDLGPYGDFVMETDNVVGEVIKALRENNILDNTLVIFTADNGTSRAADIPALEAQGHFPSAYMRGSKADIWDGGHRVPFIAQWPKVIAPSSQAGDLISLNDLFATLSDITQLPMPFNAAEDSFSFFPALLGEPINNDRKGLIHHSISGHFAYRQGKWKLLLSRGSGGWTSPNEDDALLQALPEAQLYDLEADPTESNNLYSEMPEVALRLLAQLESEVLAGHTRSNVSSANDLDNIRLWKNEPSKN